ncbi:YDG/SRA domain-containing protein [Kitasatospora sp. NPDC097643]|uniref:YDG/SRA domain-containing protein n=1 Tax=Kitasatospora sp. NPDC097643 TaxID=3157230 RepID=UPI00332253D5
MSETSQVDGFCAAVTALRVDQSSGQPARHQPITLLWAIGRAAEQQPRMVHWTNAQAELQQLLKEHGRRGSGPSPEYPFVALSRSDLWELDGYDGEVPPARGSGVRRWLNEHDPLGGLERSFYELMARDPAARKRVVDALVSRFLDVESSTALLADIRLAALGFDGFGAVPGVEVGQVFASREAAHNARVHRPLQAGICGTKKLGAESIVLSDGYEDDRDEGDVIVYTGQGGRDEKTGRQVKDQALTRGNAALVTSQATGTPVRVVRKVGNDPKAVYRYDGLFRVEESWHETGRSGFRIWRYRLVELTAPNAVTQQPTVQEPTSPAGQDAPTRLEITFQRIIRSTKVANRVKQAHDFTCQVCKVRLATPAGAYAEAAHIRGLGKPHNGPDRETNVLCLCPNHHTMFDFGTLTIADDLTVTDHSTGTVLGRLREVKGHQIDPAHLRYHREHHSESWKHQQSDAAEHEEEGGDDNDVED